MPAPRSTVRPDEVGPVATDAVLRALADPHRREIIRLIQDAELAAGQIATHFTLTQQAVSQHLTVLKRAGLLQERRAGTRRLYRFHADSLAPVRDLLDEFWPEALQRLKRAVERDHPQESGGARMTDPVTASVRIAAPPDVVFPYFTDAALAVRWIADAALLDPRPGGTFSVDVRGNPARGEYVVVDPPRRVVFTWGVEGRGDMPPGSTTVEVDLVAEGEGTVVTLTHRGLPSEETRRSHQAGWEEFVVALGQTVVSAAGA